MIFYTALHHSSLPQVWFRVTKVRVRWSIDLMIHFFPKRFLSCSLLFLVLFVVKKDKLHIHGFLASEFSSPWSTVPLFLTTPKGWIHYPLNWSLIDFPVPVPYPLAGRQKITLFVSLYVAHAISCEAETSLVKWKLDGQGNYALWAFLADWYLQALNSHAWRACSHFLAVLHRNRPWALLPMWNKVAKNTCSFLFENYVKTFIVL